MLRQAIRGRPDARHANRQDVAARLAAICAVALRLGQFTQGHKGIRMLCTVHVLLNHAQS
eukprot:14343916-Alexandrium_andersonii.AAC.1